MRLSYIQQLIISLFLCLATTHPVLATPEIVEDAIDSIKTTASNIIQPLKEKYNDLPENAKFGVGALGGYVLTKTTIRTTVKVTKYTGAAFILSEVLNHAGLLDKVSPSGNGDEMLSKAKRKVTNTVNTCRLAAEKHLSYEKFKETFDKCVEKDKMGTLGVTTGTVMGLIL